MQLIYGSHETPLAAFLEGLVRVFDWGVLLLVLRRRQRRSLLESEASQQSRRVVDRYINDAVADFESEEIHNLSTIPIIPRWGCAIVDIVLGPLPNGEVVVCYEQVVPGAVDRIMGQASGRLKDDSGAEMENFDDLCRQGSRDMIAGFSLALSSVVVALFLVYINLLRAGMKLVGINIARGVSATVYVSRAGLRRKWFTGEFFPRMFFSRNRYHFQQIIR